MQNGESPFNTTSPYKTLRDMFDGGGAGMSGEKFEGGGLLSYFANMLGTPLGSQPMNGQTPGIRPPQRPQAPMQPTMSAQGSGMIPPAPMQYSGRGDVGMPQAPMQYGGRGDVGMPQPMQMPNLMDAMQGARGNRAADALQFAADYPVNTGGQGRPRQSMTLQDQKADEIRAYLEGTR